MRIENLPVDVQGVTGTGTAQIRALPGLDEIDTDVRQLPPNRAFIVYAAHGHDTTALMSATSDSMGVIPEALAYVDFFANHYDKVELIFQGFISEAR